MQSCSARRGFTVIELLVVIGIIATILGLLMAAVQHVRETAGRARCAEQLRQIGLALHQYHDSYGRLPPGVSYLEGADPYPYMSWHTRLLPFLEQAGLWANAMQAFAQDRNFLHVPPHTGLLTVVPIFGCPSDSRTARSALLADGKTVAFTSYLGVEGTNQFRQDGVLFLDSKVRLVDITDGTSNTLCVGERPPSADGILGWWYAGEGQSQDGSGDMVLGVLERNVGPYGPNCPPGPYVFGPGNPQNQCDAFHFWSMHPGGAHFLFADGSVHFLPYSAAPKLPALATRSGGEPASLSD
jgi:prepilin-type N-terminal cleavage/methylation domain-containing protein/prepilin-type processing-associated H-X9-DG protein